MALPAFTDIASTPEFKELPDERKVELTDKYWSDYEAENPDAVDYAKEQRRLAGNFLGARSKLDSASPLARRFIERELDEAAFDLRLNEGVKLGVIPEDVAKQELERFAADNAERDARLKKTASLFDPAVSEAMGPAFQALRDTALRGGVFGSAALDARVSDVLPGGEKNVVKGSKEAYEALRGTLSSDFNLTPDEVDDVVKHQLDLQPDAVSRDAFGTPYIKNEVLAQGEEATAAAIANSNLPWSAKQKLSENLPEKLSQFRKSTVEGVRKNSPELATALGITEGDIDGGFQKLVGSLNETRKAQFATGFGAGMAGTADLLNRAAGSLPDFFKSDIPTMADIGGEGDQTVAQFAKNSLEDLATLSNQFNKSRTEIWGTDAAAFGQGAESVAEAVGLGLVTGGAMAPFSAARIATMGKAGKALATGLNGAVAVSPIAALGAGKSAMSTYDDAIAADMTDDEASDLAWRSGLIEFGTTLAFSAIPGMGGVESVGGQLSRPALRNSVREGSKKAFNSFGGKLFKGLTAEQFEEGMITALDSTMVQAKINPNMTGEEFLKGLKDTALVTLGASAGPVAVGSFAESRRKPTYEKTTEQLEVEANLRLVTPDENGAVPLEGEIPFEPTQGNEQTAVQQGGEFDSPADVTPVPGSEPAAGSSSPAPVVEAGTPAAAVAGETLPAARPSPNLPPKADFSVEPRPPRRDLEARDAWDDKYLFTHDSDGNPLQPTVLEETASAAASALRDSTFDERIDAVGTDIGVELGTALEQLLNDGWVWDAGQKRMVDPQNRGESPIQALQRIRRGPAAQTPTTGETPQPVGEPAAGDISTGPLKVFSGRGSVESAPRDAGWLGQGRYYSSDPDLARTYANLSAGDPVVEEAEVAPKRIYEATLAEKKAIQTIEEKEGREAGLAASKKFTDDLASQGYDAARLTFPDGSYELVVFEGQTGKQDTEAMRPAGGETDTSGGVPPEVGARIVELQNKAKAAEEALEALGPEPWKPRSEKKYFGEAGRAAAKPEDVARFDQGTKTYNTWRQKYLKLKKAEVYTSNEVIRAKQDAGLDPLEEFSFVAKTPETEQVAPDVSEKPGKVDTSEGPAPVEAPTPPFTAGLPAEPDRSHLAALELGLSRARVRLSKAKDANERKSRELSVRQYEKEIADEKKRLGISESESTPTDEELLAELTDTGTPSETSSFELQMIGATSGEWRTVQKYDSKEAADKALPKGSGWRIVEVPKASESAAEAEPVAKPTEKKQAEPDVSEKPAKTNTSEKPAEAQPGPPAGGETDTSAVRIVSSEEAKALLAPSDKEDGVDPKTHIQDGKTYEVAETPLEDIVANMEGERYDNTVRDPLFREYAGRDGKFPPIIVAPRKNREGKLGVVDGGHRVSAARLRGDTTITTIRRIEEPVAKPTEKKQAEPDVSEKPGKVDTSVVVNETPVPAPQVPKASTGEPQGNEKTLGTRHAKTEELRRDLGLPPRKPSDGQKATEWWDEATKIRKANPAAARDIALKVQNDPRPLSAVEEMVVLQEMRALRDQQTKAKKDLESAATEDARREALGEVELAEANELALLELMEADENAGSEWGRTGVARKMELREDFSIGRMLAVAHKANNRKPLSNAQRAEIERLHKELTEVREKLAAVETKAAKKQTDIVQKSLEKNVEKAMSKVASKEKREALRIKLDAKAEAARARIAARRGNLNALLNPEDLADYAIIGASYFRNKILSLQELTEKMVSQFGQAIRKHMGPIHAAAVDAYLETANDVGNVKTPQEVLAGLTPGEKVTKRDIYSLAKAHVIAGLRGDAVLDAVTADLQTINPGIDRDTVAKEFTDYGKVKMPNREEIATQLRNIRAAEQVALKLADALQGKAPLRSGYQRDDDTPEVLKLKKELNAAMRAAGIRTTSSKQQIRSALDTAKARMQNEMEVRRLAIKSETPLPGKVPPNYTEAEKAELAKMQAELDQVRKDYDAAFAKPGLTDKQRLAILEKSFNRRIAEEERMLSEGILSRQKEVLAGPWSPKLAQLQQRLENLRQRRRNARIAALPKKDPVTVELERQEQSLLRRLAAEEKLIAEGKTSFDRKEAAMNFWSPKLAAMQARLDTMREQRAALRASRRVTRDPAEVEIERAEKSLRKSIERMDEILKTGKLPEASTDAMAWSPNISALIKERGRLNDAVKALRKSLAPGGVKTEDQKAAEASIKALDKHIAELDRRITTGDLSFPAKPVDRAGKDPRVQALRDRRKAMAETLKTLRKAAGMFEIPDAVRLERDKTALRKRAAKLRDRISKGDFEKATRKDPVTDREKRVLQLEEAKLKHEWATLRSKMLLQRAGFAGKAWHHTKAGINLLRIIKLGGELGAATRQGFFFTLKGVTQPRVLLDGYKKAGVSTFSRAHELELWNHLNDPDTNPNAVYYKDMGVVLHGPHSEHTGLSEDIADPEYLEKMAALKGALAPLGVPARVMLAIERFTRTIINVARVSAADNMIAAMGPERTLTKNELKVLGNSVGVSTGRYAFGNQKYDTMVSAMNVVNISARWALSRLAWSIGQPLWTVKGGYAGTGRARMAALREAYVRPAIGYIALIYGIAAAARAIQDDDDETNDKFKVNTKPGLDFGTMNYAGEDFDFSGGVRPYLRLLTKYGNWAGEGKFGIPKNNTDMDYEVRRFLENRRNPFYAWIRNTTLKDGYYGGREKTVATALDELITPVIVRDAINLSRKQTLDNVDRSILFGLLQAGASMQTNPPKTPGGSPKPAKPAQPAKPAKPAKPAQPVKR